MSALAGKADISRALRSVLIASEDIARAVLDRAQKEDRPIGKGAQEFLEHALGVTVLGGLR